MIFSDYERALRELSGEELSPDADLDVFQVVPRRSGTMVGFRIHRGEDELGLAYVEPVDSSPVAPPLGFRVLENGKQVRAWRYPADPHLPILPSVVIPEALAILLDRMGLDSKILGIHLVGYRPSRRAVVRVVAAQEVYYLKVVRPKTLIELVERHNAVGQAGVPTPKLLGWSPAGLLVFSEAEGTVLSSLDPTVIRPHDAVDLVLSAAEMIQRVTLDKPARNPVAESSEWYFDNAKSLLPEFEPILRRIQRNVTGLLARAQAGKRVSIHGDLHAGQVFVSSDSPRRVTAVIDVDGVGEGYPADDLATFWAHSLVTAELSALPTHRDYWKEVARLLAAMQLPQEERDRVRAGAVVSVVGHALNLSQSDAERAESLLRECEDIL